MSSVPERADVDEQYKWDLASLFADREQWQESYAAVEQRLSDLEAYEGQVTDDAETLQAVLELREEIARTVADVATYAQLKQSEDTTDSDYQALAARAGALRSQAESAGSFIEPEIQSLSREEVDALVEANPDLAVYEHYFDDVLRQKAHTRSPEVESLLADLGEVLGSTGEVYSQLTNADIEFPTVEDPDGEARQITLSNFTTFQQHPDREFRQAVHEAFYETWDTYRNAIAAAYKNSVKTDIKVANARGYDSARAKAMDEPNVPVEVYDTLVDTVNANLDPLHRHAALKRDAMGADDLRMWDLYAPMVDSESPDIPYEDACDYVIEAVAPLGEDYQQRLSEGLNSRWVDVYETDNKRSGAFSSGTYDSQPYVLMNYQDDISSMFTLAHELGHSLHSAYTRDTQPHVYSDYELFVAEVASTVNETLLTHHLLDTVEDEQLRRHVLDQYLERIRSTLYRQTMFAEFEHRVHERQQEGEAITADRLDDLYADLKSTYYQPAVVDDMTAHEWMRIPHFYRAYYVYQYATGISAASALVDGILEEGEPAAERYVDFLKQGSREYPIDLLRGAGVDMTSADPVRSAVATYDSFLDEFEQLS
jgi:oligoendopeptidase F